MMLLTCCLSGRKSSRIVRTVHRSPVDSAEDQDEDEDAEERPSLMCHEVGPDDDFDSDDEGRGGDVNSSLSQSSSLSRRSGGQHF